MKVQQSFQLLELVLLPLAKNLGDGDGSESTVASKTGLQIPLSLMSKLALTRVQLQARPIKLITFSQVSYCEHSSKTQKNYSSLEKL